MNAPAHFDAEAITARDLRDTLRRMAADPETGMSAARLAALIGLTDDAVLKMLRGDSLRHVVQFCQVVDALGYRVKFTKQARPKRVVRLV